MRTRTIRALATAVFAVTLATSSGCGGKSSTSSSHPGADSVATEATASPPVSRRPSYVGRVQFGRTSWADDAIAGSLLVDGQSIAYRVDVASTGTVHAEYEDTHGNVVRAVVHSDGRRHVDLDGHRIVVSAEGAVKKDAFAALSPAMRGALGMVPIDLACANSEASGPMMEAVALPFNLLQRAEPGVLTPSDLLPAATCARTSTSADRSSILIHARLVVAPGVSDWVRGT